MLVSTWKVSLVTFTKEKNLTTNLFEILCFKWNQNILFNGVWSLSMLDSKKKSKTMAIRGHTWDDWQLRWVHSSLNASLLVTKLRFMNLTSKLFNNLVNGAPKMSRSRKNCAKVGPIIIFFNYRGVVHHELVS